MTEIRRGRIRSRRRKQREKDKVVIGFSSELGEEKVDSHLVWQVPETMGLAAVQREEGGGVLQAVYAAACRCLGVLCPLDR